MESRTEAYTACHQIMMTNDNYVAHEAKGSTYIIVQVTELDESIAIQGYVVNPTIKESGSIADFIQLPLDQQIAVFALPRVTEQVRKAHQALEQLMELSNGDEKDAKKCIAQLQHFFRHAMKRHED